MDKAILEYKKRRQARMDKRYGVKRESNFDSIEEFRKRREKRLEERMDAGVGWVYGILQKNGVDTKGMSVKEAFEELAKINGGEGGGKTSKSGEQAKSTGENDLSENKKYKSTYKTPGGVRFPEIKKGAKWDGSVLSEVERLAKKAGKEKEYDEVMSKLTSKDVVYQKGVDGTTVASIPGLATMYDNKMVGRSKECQKIYDDKVAQGKRITSDLIGVTSKMGIRLLGLENCFKGGESTAGKIDRKRQKDFEVADKKLKKGEITEEEAAKMKSKTDEDYTKEFDDVVRFTAICKHQDTVKTVKDMMKKMEDSGYECVKLDNKWPPEKDENGKDLPPMYKAVHLKFKAPKGEIFEVQIHSAESMEIKNMNHESYEEYRDVKTKPERKEELGAFMAKNAAKFPVPDGVMELKSFEKNIS